MIGVKEAKSIIKERKIDLGIALVSLENAVGKILAEDIHADRDFPPFNRVMMDGIAISYDSYYEGKIFKVENIVAAGQVQYTLQNKENCVEIMTGSPLPIGCDTVIRYEDLIEETDGYSINIMPPKAKNVHPQASDYKAGSLLLSRGHEIKAAETNVLATVGKSTVHVFQQPKIVVISSGDELVGLDESPLPHQIRKSNSHMTKSALSLRGISSDLVHISDNKAYILEELRKLQIKYDVFILSGGVSKGKYDFIPECLEEIGIEKKFHRVEQRPGKPFWFGYDVSTTVFAFPGNPVSTLVGLYYYFMSWLEENYFLGSSPKSIVMLAEDFQFKPKLTRFLHCTVSCNQEGIWEAKPLPTNGSGDLVSPAFADGFIELPAADSNFTRGSLFPFYSYKK